MCPVSRAVVNHVEANLFRPTMTDNSIRFYHRDSRPDHSRQTALADSRRSRLGPEKVQRNSKDLTTSFSILSMRWTSLSPTPSKRCCARLCAGSHGTSSRNCITSAKRSDDSSAVFTRDPAADHRDDCAHVAHGFLKTANVVWQSFSHRVDRVTESVRLSGEYSAGFAKNPLDQCDGELCQMPSWSQSV